MVTRAELMRNFGPILLEAVVKVTIEDLNRIRANAGMPAITEEMFLQQISDKLPTLEHYDWMET